MFTIPIDRLIITDAAAEALQLAGVQPQQIVDRFQQNEFDYYGAPLAEVVRAIRDGEEIVSGYILRGAEAILLAVYFENTLTLCLDDEDESDTADLTQ